MKNIVLKVQKKEERIFQKNNQKAIQKGVYNINKSATVYFVYVFFCFVIYFQRLQVIIKDLVLVVSCDRFRWFWRLLFHFVWAVSDPLIS